MKKRLLIILSVSAAGVLAVFSGLLLRQNLKLKTERNSYKVIKVLDGDSFIIPPDQSVRLAKVNAPELRYCFGKEAKENLEKLILGKRVKIEKVGIDKFKRLVALVYLNNELVNQIILAKGWGKYTSGSKIDSALSQKLKEASRRAREKQLGVWSPLCYQKANPINPKCNIKGNLGKHENGEKKTYHYPGCSEYDRTVVELDLGEQWFCSEEEARAAGYQKSEHCFKAYEK